MSDSIESPYCKRPECQAKGSCAHCDERGHSWCFGDARLKDKKWVSDAYEEELVRRYQAGLHLSRVDKRLARKIRARGEDRSHEGK
jgi:hypothetical protein